MINPSEVFRKAGFKVTPLPPAQLTPEQEEHLRNVNQQVRKFLKMMDEARKASEHSKLRFKTPIARHSNHRSSAPKLYQKNRD